MTKRQPAGVPVGGQFAANDHDEAMGVLSHETPRFEDAERIEAKTVRVGDTVFFPKFENGRDTEVAHQVTKVERMYGILDRRLTMKISLDGVDADTLGEGAGEYLGSHTLNVVRGDYPTGRNTDELTSEVRGLSRELRRSGTLSGDDQDKVVSAVLDPGSDDMVVAYANRIAMSADDSMPEFAARLREAIAARH